MITNTCVKYEGYPVNMQPDFGEFCQDKIACEHSSHRFKSVAYGFTKCLISQKLLRKVNLGRHIRPINIP